jgi:hypothetical protein
MVALQEKPHARGASPSSAPANCQQIRKRRNDMTPKSETESQIQLEIIKGRANPIEIRQVQPQHRENPQRKLQTHRTPTERSQTGSNAEKGTLTLMHFRFLAAQKTRDFCMRPFEDRRFRHL